MGLCMILCRLSHMTFITASAFISTVPTTDIVKCLRYEYYANTIVVSSIFHSYLW